MQGETKSQYPNGLISVGKFEQGRRIGKGTFINDIKVKYEGPFKGFFPNGEGILYFEDGTIFNGIFKDGEKTGSGYIKFSNGIEFFGFFLIRQGS